MIDHDSFEVLGRWEVDRGPQYLAYDFAWHLGYDTLITSEWGTPNMVEGGVNPELLLNGKYGHALHVWDLRKRRHLQTLDLGAEQQMVLELRPAHDPTKPYGFVGVVVSLKDLSASIWLWHRAGLEGAAGTPQGNGNGGAWAVRKVIEIPAAPAVRGLHLGGHGLSTTLLGQDLAAVLVHTAAMLLTMGLVAVVVYDRLGVSVLRRAWVNFDALWAVAVIVAGVLTLFT